MTSAFREIRVFISSRCIGDYKSVRRKLYALLEGSSVFEPSMFEEFGATTCQPREAYIRELVDCDVCVFIVRKGDGLSAGVLDEVDCAIRNKKKLLFFFVGFEDEGCPEELKDRISSTSMPVYQSSIKRLEDVPLVAFCALQTDVLNVYRGYCNSFYVADTHDGEDPTSTRLPFSHNYGLPKSTIRGIGATIEVFNEFILGESEKDIEAQGDVDRCCCDLARRFMFDGSVETYDWDSLVRAFAESLGEQYPSDVIGLRWNSICAYYRRDFKSALDYQNQAYEVAKSSQSPDWLLDDIVIDLRNIDSIETLISAPYQELLDKREVTLSYPSLDRENSDFYSDLVKEQRKEKEKSIYIITYGNALNSPIGHLAKIFLIAAAYGSLTHLLIMRDRLEAFAIHLCDMYGNESFGMLLMKVLLCSGDGKRVERMTQSIEGLGRPSSSASAYEAYEMVKKCASPLHSEAAHFEAFRKFGVYMMDAEFRMASTYFMSAAQSFKISKIHDINAGKSLVGAIQANAQRLDHQWVIEQFLKLLENAPIEICEKVLNAIKNVVIDFRSLDESSISQLIHLIGETVKRNPDYLGSDAAIALFVICRERPEFVELCIQCVEDNLNDRSKNIFFTEFNIEDENMLLSSIERYLERIEEDNRTQGINGAWSHSMMAEYENVGNLIECLENVPQELLKRAARASLGTIDNDRRMLKDKRRAYILLLRLLSLSDAKTIDNIGISIDGLSNIVITDQSSPMLGENESLLDISICHEALLLAIGIKDASKLEDLLIETYGAREFDQAVAAEVLKYMLRAIGSEKLKDEFASFLHAYAGALYRSDVFQVRIEVVELLFEMLRIPLISADISRQLVASYDSKSPNEKCRIIRHESEIRNANNEAWEDLRRKAANDSCAISRELAKKMFCE